jgi:hypothetical protein
VVFAPRGFGAKPEGEFLALGNNLFSYLKTANSISADLRASTELTSGEQGQEVREGLANILDQCSQMQTSTVQRTENLQHL